jgi:3-hydroxyisobutyrate dehydrogenase
MRTAFIGLGVMGYPMAGYLSKSGCEVVVYNRTPARAAQWCREYMGSSAPTPAAAASGADIVFTCVGNDDDVREVILGEQGALGTMSSGAILVDHTTASARLARELYETAAKQGVGFLDAPLSGGQAKPYSSGHGRSWTATPRRSH